ncbi:hypothetical protein HPB52_023159 [Rhipicephalus sanguineus]|uniref:Uncharacterized protein n=1 Tax=Rhipicephalus sanguineus TaxID=34632 RepID=A0A9D4PY75_RHISA|nr:hypothetical protein HPB52_023159 [Rhipicephalus sanguineus]
MGDQNPIQQLGPGRPHHSASDASDHFGPSVVHIDTSDGSSTEDMASDSDFTVVSSRRLKRKIRRTSPTDILNSLNRQSLSEYFELVAPGQVAEIRINARKNILSVEVTTKSILDTLKAIVQLGNISVRAFSAYDKETTTGVIYDVDEDITDSSLEKLLSSSSPIVGFHRFGRRPEGDQLYRLPEASVKVASSGTLPMTPNHGLPHSFLGASFLGIRIHTHDHRHRRGPCPH